MLVKEHKLLAIRLISSGDLMYSIVIIASNNVLYAWKSLRGDFKYSHYTKLMVINAIWYLLGFNAQVVIIWYTSIKSTHCTPEITQCYLSVISQ